MYPTVLEEMGCLTILGVQRTVGTRGLPEQPHPGECVGELPTPSFVGFNDVCSKSVKANTPQS